MSNKAIVKIILSILLIILLISSITIVKTSEVGIKSTLGVIHNTPLEAGVHLKAPFFQSIDKVSLKQHQETSNIYTQTSDLQPAKVEYQVMYSIPSKMVIHNKKTISGDLFEVLIKKRVDESIRDVLAQYPAEQLISNRSLISNKVIERATERVKQHAEIDDIAILSFNFENQQWVESINRKVKAKQDAETAEINKKQAQAEADQKIILAKADAEALRIKGNTISNNPKVIELEKINKWNGMIPLDAKTVVVGDKSMILNN